MVSPLFIYLLALLLFFAQGHDSEEKWDHETKPVLILARIPS